jgi:zinc transporter 5/7
MYSLNFSFMLVQAFYGYLTDSLGLLSDSIHMFFDCLALAVGLFAAVASKWPPSERFPYGFGKIESLSGFGNGVFLMYDCFSLDMRPLLTFLRLISIEIMTEATERLAEGHETKRLAELFVVSGLGLAVNLIGMACFGHHGHAGHDHGHSHGHSHDHSHSYSQGENYSHDEHHHDHSHDCDQDHNSLKAGKAHAHVGHSHSHDNENMHGIFLHVLADTMGSAAVMVSTALIYFVGWNGWDPLASCIIAILIFLSSIPLIKSCAKKLLLTVPDNVEYSLRETLSGVSDIRGVASYFVPRFWMGDKNTDSENEQVLGVMHIIATRGSDLDDVRERTRTFLLSHGMDVVVQVEKDADTSCWCGGSSSRTPSRFS